jgi:hypothetical protein
MKILRKKTAPMLIEVANPMILFHRTAPSYGILCVEDLTITGENQRQRSFTRFNMCDTSNGVSPVYSHILGANSCQKLLTEVNKEYSVKTDTLKAVLAITEGYIGEWGYVGKEDHYRIIALWKVQYKENYYNYLGHYTPIHISKRDKVAFGKVRGKKPE